MLKSYRDFHSYEGVNHVDYLLEINNALGFGIASGDTIELTKVVNKYDGKGGGKVVVPPSHFIIDHITPKFIYFGDGTYIYNDPTTYIKIPASIKKALDSGDKTVKAVQDTASNIGSGITNIFSGLFDSLKWILIAIVLLVVIAVVLKFKS
jgi:hypothetical protein